MNDLVLEQKIKDFQAKIISWAKKNDVWQDSSFQTYFEHFDDEPSEISACVSVMGLDGGLIDIINGYGEYHLNDEFNELVDSTDFWFERYSSDVIQFYCRNEDLNKYYLDYFEWKWISQLIEPNYTSLYQEIFNYFSSRPKKLYSLSPRKLEILISEIFTNQGYQTELGSGWNDGGVDLKLFQKDEIDQIVTLVQVKRYKEDLPINLESVAYLQAIVDEQKANRGLFVTTSRYLPQAKDFATRQNRKLILADSNDVSRWCETAKTKIIRDKSLVLTNEYVLNLLKSNFGLVGKVVVASVGVTMILNEFCIIVKDTESVSLLMKISSTTIRNYDSLRGEEIPLLDESILQYKNKDNVFRAKKTIDSDGSISFWGKKNLYFIWDGKPKYFDWAD